MDELTHGILKSIFDDNAGKVRELPNKQLMDIGSGQTPRATVVTCSDSRVQIQMFEDSPVNNLFVVRNIGNQIANAMGSIEFGIRYLHTPVLIIIGHVDCGAVKAALSDYSKVSKPVHHELEQIKISRKLTPEEGVIANINYQVDLALKKFAGEVDAEKLIIIGAVYDFKDLYKQGYNRLIVLNVNGEKDPSIIKENKYLQNIDSATIGTRPVED